ncbi:MAG: RsmE family RNA methyltransferase, partial [Ignavibacteriales bacterium]|nr:RsmE family RNA methyltransferase [Ignavibacteriales bacterium]
VGKEYAFVIGPEGGFSERELALFQTSDTVTLTSQRLRSETAIIYAASLLTKLI